MLPISDIRGLIYPDEYVVRHFFKNGLKDRPGRVLELGCGDGNNLSLYAGFGWHVTGVDYDPEALANARWNLGDGAVFVQHDLEEGPPPVSGPFDVLLIPNVLCCVAKVPVWRTLAALRPLLAPGACVYVRTRLVDDYRYGRGSEALYGGIILDTPETGEEGRYAAFYQSSELRAMLEGTFNLKGVVELRCRFDNLARGTTFVPGNSDGIMWGRLPG